MPRTKESVRRDRQLAGGWTPPGSYLVLFVPEAKHYLALSERERLETARDLYLETGKRQVFAFVDIYAGDWQILTDQIEAIGITTPVTRARARLLDDMLESDAGPWEEPKNREGWQDGDD